MLSTLSTRVVVTNIIILFWCLKQLGIEMCSFDSIDWFGDGDFVDIVRDDPTNNVPDTIFTKLGMQLHKRNQHPIGILKNAIYEYFDSNYPNKFNKFDDLCPIVSVKQVCL